MKNNRTIDLPGALDAGGREGRRGEEEMEENELKEKIQDRS